jgi:hypothetical protein
VRTSCYLRDIDRDYDVFNAGRTAFFKEQGLDPLPASTGIQAHLCRPELLIEIEAIAMFRTDKGRKQGVAAMRKGWLLVAVCACGTGCACVSCAAQDARPRAIRVQRRTGKGTVRVWRASAGTAEGSRGVPYAGEPAD